MVSVFVYLFRLTLELRRLWAERAGASILDRETEPKPYRSQKLCRSRRLGPSSISARGAEEAGGCDLVWHVARTLDAGVRCCC